MMMQYGNSSGFVRISLMLISMMLPTLAIAGHEEVINADWKVTDSREGLTDNSCGGDTCLRVGDRFEVQANRLSAKGHGLGWLVIDRDGSHHAAFEALIRVHKDKEDELTRVDVYFLDDLASDSSLSTVPLKRMRITPVSEPDLDSCKRKFQGLDRGEELEHYDYSKACPADSTIVAHWSVCSLDSYHNCNNYSSASSAGTSSTRGVPDDGQGAGGPD